MNKINPEAQKRFKSYFFQLKIIFIGVIAGIFLFAVAIWMITGYGAEPVNPALDPTLVFATPISGCAFILLSFRLYARSIEKVLNEKTLFEKMQGFRYGILFRLVALDGAGFLMIISFMFTCNELYLYLLGPVILVTMTSFPTVEKFVTDLRLSPVEEQVVRDHTA